MRRRFSSHAKYVRGIAAGLPPDSRSRRVLHAANLGREADRALVSDLHGELPADMVASLQMRVGSKLMDVI